MQNLITAMWKLLQLNMVSDPSEPPPTPPFFYFYICVSCQWSLCVWGRQTSRRQSVYSNLAYHGDRRKGSVYIHRLGYGSWLSETLAPTPYVSEWGQKSDPCFLLYLSTIRDHPSTWLVVLKVSIIIECDFGTFYRFPSFSFQWKVHGIKSFI